MTEATVERPLHENRYGRTREPKRRLSPRAMVLAGIVLVAVVVVIAFAAFRPQSTPSTPRTLSYSVVDSSSTLVTVAIFPDRERDVHCSVQATNDFEAVVGFTEVTVPADPDADPNTPKALEVDLSTTQLASSGHVDTCWFE